MLYDSIYIKVKETKLYAGEIEPLGAGINEEGVRGKLRGRWNEIHKCICNIHHVVPFRSVYLLCA